MSKNWTNENRTTVNQRTNEKGTTVDHLTNKNRRQ